jgi:hypothetical protein
MLNPSFVCDGAAVVASDYVGGGGGRGSKHALASRKHACCIPFFLKPITVG